MKLKEVLEKEISKISLDEIELEKINGYTDFIVESLKKNLKKKKIKADVFVGGSLAKNTLIDKKVQDVDVFVRFSKSEDIEKLNSCFNGISGKLEKIHGSRDYFKLKFKEVIFEIVPVLKISNPEKAENITDLSYFHVSYVMKSIKKNPKLGNEIKLAKSFCHGQRCYGAESYIRGFSGYGLELLIIHYGSFEKFIKAMIKTLGKIVIDPSKFYKNKDDVYMNMNEAKLESPIVFVDPTFKQRNTLAALSQETFSRFKIACKKFLKSPSLKYFEIDEIDENKLFDFAKKRKLEFLKLKIKTDRQEGDIAGTKLHKFYRFLINKIEKYFDVVKKEFVYNDKKEAEIYFVLKSRKEIVVNGPPKRLEIRVKDFKKKWKNAKVKNGVFYAKEKVNFSGKKYVDVLKKKYKNVIKEMGGGWG